MTDKEIQAQLEEIQRSLRGKATNGSSLWGKLAAAALLPTFVGLVGYGALQQTAEQNRQNIGKLSEQVSDTRRMAVETRQDVAIIQDRQKEQITLLKQYTSALETVRNSQAQYVGEITSQLQTTAQALSELAGEK